ncbi:MAG: Ig-like domain-containing protein [Alphaproteobacteria bacterium]|nr:Ig-like domain-containing protein [Alphaproteobacteria bacterium]
MILRVALSLLASCSGPKPNLEPPQPAQPVEAAEPLEWEQDDALVGLRMRLSEVDAPKPGGGGSAAPLAAPKPLGEPDQAKLLRRVPELEQQADDVKAFAKREDSKPPPRTGADVKVPFPAPEDAEAPAVASGPLEVVRWAPEGEVPVAPRLNLTFNQPMVAVTSHEQASKTVPLTLEPQPPGEWRWIGTRTIVFEPEGRFPMATDYTVTVPAGTSAKSGGELAEAKSYTFSTPPVAVEMAWPSYGPQALDPLIFLRFNQAIDEAAIAAHVELRAGKTLVPLRAATDLEVQTHETIKQLTDGAEPHRFVVLAPEQPLKPDTSYVIRLAKGAPSAEGPRLSAANQDTSFYTYAPLQDIDQSCAWGLDGCAPGGAFWVSFNNPLDAEAFDATAVTIQPPIEGLRAMVSGSGLTVMGKTQANTSYTVTLPASLKDSFGQTLGKDKKRTFKVGNAPKQLQGPGKEFVVLDPTAPPAFTVFSTNHERLRVRVWKLQPEDFVQVSKWMREARYDNYFSGSPGGTLAVDTKIKVEDYKPDELVESNIDLAPYLDDGKGLLFVWVEPSPQARERWERVDVMAFVQATNIGLHASVTGEEVLGWATSLHDGSPLPGVKLSLLGRDQSTSTDADGLGRLDPYADGQGPHALVARKGDEVAILPEQLYWWNEYGSWSQSQPATQLRWFVFDDRKLYRPGETVKVKGWLRRFEPTPTGDIGGLDGAVTALRYELYDSRGNKLTEGDAEVSAAGGFDLSIDLPGTPNLGNASLQLHATTRESLSATSHYHSFRIEEFRRPEYEVTTELDPRPYVLGEHAEVSVSANYYSGGALPDAEVSWTVTAAQSSYSPPNHSDFNFGAWSPWWGWGGLRSLGYWGGPAVPTNQEYLAGKTDASGKHHLRVDFLALNPARPTSVTAEATVIDVNRQRWTSTETLLLHPASLYVGLRSPKALLEKDEEAELEVVVVDIEGQRQEGVDVQLRVARLDWQVTKGRWEQIEVDPTDCKLASEGEPVTCAFTPSEGGSYRVTARLKDAEGRPNETVMELYVPGGKQPPKRHVELEQLQLIPDKEQYKAGDVAQILIQAPFSPATGQLSLRRNGARSTEVFSMEEPSKVLNIEITEDMVPNLFVHLELEGSAERTNDQGEPMPDKGRRVAYATGELNLPVPPRQRTLKVEVLPDDAALPPGGETTLRVKVTDAGGQPVEAEVALVAVDEAVLALAAYKLPDPLEVFYAQVGAGVRDFRLRDQSVLANPDSVLEGADLDKALEGLSALGYIQSEGEADFGGLGMRGQGMPGGGAATGAIALDEISADAPAPPPMSAPMEEKAKREDGEARSRSSGSKVSANRGPMGSSAGGEEVGPAIDLRTDLSALALFSPHVTTDAQGVAAVPLALPDSLTRYRVMVVAAAGDKQFGSGETHVTARKPIMLRPSPPRFLNFGDRMELPLVIQNQTDGPLSVDLAVRMTNARIDDEGDKPVRHAGRRVEIPANDRREVRIPVAAMEAGTARFQAVIASGDFSDAAEFSIPIWTPATSEAFATYGELDGDAVMVQPVEAPPGTWPQFGGLEVTTSSTALQALTDALLYLVQYPYECSEQISSRVLAVAALRDVLTAFEAEQLPEPEALEAAVIKDLERLQRRQQGNGGWGFWGNTRTEPYLTVHVTHAIVRAQAKGYEIDGNMLNRARRYLNNIESHIPWYYSDQARWSIIAYSVYVRHQLGDDDLGRAKKLLAEGGLEGLPLEAQGWILPTLHAKGQDTSAMLRHWANNATETAAAAHFVTGYSDKTDYVLLHSSRRTDGVLLDSLIEVDPKNELIPKVVRGLLGHQVRGRWSTTQENSFVLLSMDRYFRTYESKTPDFVARVWLGEEYGGEQVFKGRETDRRHLEVPMALLTDPGGEQDLILQKQGAGRLYYRVGLRYAPEDLVLEPADHGFSVERRYVAVDDPGDVSRDADGTWHVKAGARVRVKLTMVAEARRTHVALVDPLPAGLEPLNPALATTGAIPEDPNEQASGGRYWWWSRTWYEHQNLRDERVEAFTSLLWDGVHEYSYVAIATTPGRFVVPPTKAEEMYHPETFGRTSTDIVIVE